MGALKLSVGLGVCFRGRNWLGLSIQVHAAHSDSSTPSLTSRLELADSLIIMSNSSTRRHDITIDAYNLLARHTSKARVSLRVLLCCYSWSMVGPGPVRHRWRAYYYRLWISSHVCTWFELAIERSIDSECLCRLGDSGKFLREASLCLGDSGNATVSSLQEWLRARVRELHLVAGGTSTMAWVVQREVGEGAIHLRPRKKIMRHLLLMLLTLMLYLLYLHIVLFMLMCISYFYWLSCSFTCVGSFTRLFAPECLLLLACIRVVSMTCIRGISYKRKVEIDSYYNMYSRPTRPPPCNSVPPDI